jgi:hypothetical protein
MTATITTAGQEAGSLVLYHGSQIWMRGEWALVGPCACERCAARLESGEEARWELVDIWGRDRITCVRRESFTPYSEIPLAPAPDAHKTRTSQPSGYACDDTGSRRSDKRGRLMYDRGSFWFCTCGEVGAGADREEARSSARRHREQEAGRERAEYEAALVGLQAKLEGRPS